MKGATSPGALRRGWLGGGSGRDNEPPTKEADPITARAVVVGNGTSSAADWSNFFDLDAAERTGSQQHAAS